MNKDQVEKFRNRHLQQKYDLLHFVPTIGTPELSGLYLKSFLNGAKRYRVKLPESIVKSGCKFCSNCGATRVPLYNTNMIVQNEATRKLVLECMHCSHKDEFSMKQGVDDGKRAFVAAWPKKPSTTAKDRSKKRKMNSLSHMLSKKKEQDSRNSSSLTLESFMK